MHSFYVPEFRIKQDVVPGRYTETWFEATKPGPLPHPMRRVVPRWHSQMGARSWSAGARVRHLARRADRPGRSAVDTGGTTKDGDFRGRSSSYGRGWRWPRVA